MGRLVVAVIGALLPGLAGAQAPALFDAHRQVSAAIASIRGVAMNADRLDWAAIDAQAQTAANGAKDEADLLPVYGAVLAQLDDHHHSRLLVPPPLRATYVARHPDHAIPQEIPPAAQAANAIEGRPVGGDDVPLAGGRVARLVHLPGFNGRDADGAFAGSIDAALGATPTVCGYVVDLREDTGGNLFPMVAGMASLLGDGYRMAVPMGRATAPVVLEHGAVTGYERPGGPGQVLARLPGWRSRPAMATAPVAVLLSKTTASSGEEVAVQFVGRPATRSFGQRTAGQVTANQPLPQPSGVVFFVATGQFPDRNGGTYPEGLTPDEPTGPAIGGKDPTLAAAAAWLAQQPGCRG